MNEMGEEITKTELDRLAKAGEFRDRFPQYIETVCCGGYDVAYTEDRRAGGYLKDGRQVWAWVRGKNVKKEQA